MLTVSARSRCFLPGHSPVTGQDYPHLWVRGLGGGMSPEPRPPRPPRARAPADLGKVAEFGFQRNNKGTSHQDPEATELILPLNNRRRKHPSPLRT